MTIGTASSQTLVNTTMTMMKKRSTGTHRANAAPVQPSHVIATSATALMDACVHLAIAISNNGYNIGKYHGNHH